MQLGKKLRCCTPLQLIASILVLVLIGPAPSPAQITVKDPPQPVPDTQIQNCGSPSFEHILPYPCSINDTQLPTSVVNNIYAFEDEGLTEFLKAYDLPTSHDAFLAIAGKDLRDEVRAFLLTKFITIIQKPAAQRSVRDTDVYNWVNALLTDLEKKVYAAADLEYLSYVRNPCGYVIDSTIGPAFNVVYDSTNCFNYGTAFAQPRQPSAEYYLAVGANAVYSKLTSDPGIVNTVTTLSPLVELSLSTAVAGGFAAGSAVQAAYSSIAPFAARAALDLAEAGGEAAGEALGAVGTGAGVFGIITAALLVLVQGSIDFSNAQKVIDDLNTFKAQYQATLAPGYQFDLPSAILNSQQNWKLTDVWAKLSSANTDQFPQVPPAPHAVLISHGYLPVPTVSTGQSYNDLFVQSSPQQGGDHFVSVDWEGRLWKVTLYGDRYFIKTCLSAGSKKDAKGNVQYPCYGPEIAHSLETVYPTNSTIAGWVDMSNKAVVARNGDNKFMVRIFGSYNYEPLPADHDCAVNPATGVSAKAYLIPDCTSFITDSAYFLTSKDAYKGPTDAINADFERVRIIPPPTITSAPTAGFQLGQASSFSLTAINPSLPGVPINFTLGVCPGDPFTLVLDDQLPNSISLIPGPVGTAKIAYNGAVPAPGDIVLNGPFNIHICAQQQQGDAIVTRTGPLQISLGTGSRILSGTQPTVYWGVPFSLKVYASGNPTPSLTINNLALNDVEHELTFQDNHDGSATISGMFPYGYNLVPNGFFPGKETSITASNGLSSDTKLFAMTAGPAPAPTLSIPDLTFVAGKFSSHTITTSGALVTPVFFAYPSTTVVSPNPTNVTPINGPTNPLPGAPWLTFQDNRNGTATISGTPPMNSNIDVNLQLVTTASQFIPLITPLTLPIRDEPYFTSPDTAIFTVGTLGNFPLGVANSGRVGLFGGLPPGLFLSGNTITGTPPAGSAGRYLASLLSLNGWGASGQTLTIYVVEHPTLYSTAPQQDSIVVQAGIKTKITFSASGYPKSPPPSGAPAALGAGMSITASNSTIPPDYYTFSDKDSEGKVYGGAVLTMNPPANAEGLYALTLTADNGIPSPSTLNLSVRVVKAGDVNQDSAINCADVSIVRASLGKRNGQPGYDVRADVNLDGVVDARDLAFVGSRLPAGSVCQ